MRVLYCVSEVAPIIKVGGLGDVAGSLPKALQALGVDIAIVVPAYEEVKTRINADLNAVQRGSFGVEFAGKQEQVIVWQTTLPGSTVPVYLLENETYLSKNGHQAFTGTEEEIERFAFFSKSIAEFLHLGGVMARASHLPATIRGVPWFPDLLHLNDWHTSLVPLLLTETHNPPSLLTIHNLSYQGLAPLDLLPKLGLKPDSCEVLKWDAENRDIDILMEGIIHADFVNTVSPTYTRQILTPEYGWGIEGVLKGKEGRVVGILNGIDHEVWNPATDHNIAFNYEPAVTNFSVTTSAVVNNAPVLDSGLANSDNQRGKRGSSKIVTRRLLNIFEGKLQNKKFLQKELGLTVDEKIPLLAFIGRLDPEQKGLDILYETMEEVLPKEQLQFVMLGVGEEDWEEKFKVQSVTWLTKFFFANRFDERLAHQIYAGADVILVPSKFEPCGLPQMIGMRYGTLPLVRKTGGLADTVIDGTNGFVFKEYSGRALANKIKEALEKINPATAGQQSKIKMIENAMRQDFSWERSAREYLLLYKKICNL